MRCLKILGMAPLPLSDLLRLVEADIAAFEARMRTVVPAYQVGDG